MLLNDEIDRQIDTLVRDQDYLLGALKDVVCAYCYSEQGDVIASTLRPAGVTALLLLAMHGRVRITEMGEHRVEGVWLS